MRLKAHMINVKYSKEYANKSTKEIKIESISFLDEKNYKDGTSLGNDDKDCWYTYTHYRGKNKSQTMYQLGFELIDLDENEKNKEYNLFITCSEDKDISYSLKYHKEYNIYFDSSKGKINTKKNKIEFSNGTEYISVGIYTSGIFYVDVFDSTGAKMYTSPPICVLPSSITYDDYIYMINDLLKIKDDLVINNKAKVALKGSWEYRKDSIINCLNNINKPLKKIDKNPAVNLLPEWRKVTYKSIKNVKSRTLIEREILPYKNKYTMQNYSESVDIYENRMIKYALSRLRDKVKRYREAHNEEFLILEKEVNKLKEPIEHKHNEKVEDILIELNTEIQNKEFQINQLEEIYIKNIESMLENNKGATGDFEVCFSFYKEYELTDKNISLKIGENECTLIIKSNDYKNDVFDLDLHRKEYYYKSNKERIEAQFHGRKLVIQLDSCKINEVIFLIEKLVETRYDNIQNIINICAEARRVTNDPTDPLGGEVVKRYANGGLVKNYYIRLTKIHSINDDKVPEYDKDYMIEKLLLYIDNPVFHQLKDKVINLSEHKSFIQSIIRKVEISDNRKIAFQSQEDNWDTIEDNISSLLSLDIFKGVKDVHCSWKPTQIFVNHKYYSVLWKNLRWLDHKIDFINNFDSKSFGVKSTKNLYEYWCFYKMIQVLVKEQKWEIENYNEIYSAIEDYIELNKNNNFKAVLSHQINEDNKIKLTIWYNRKIYYTDNNYKQPDYMFVFDFNNESKISYIDAKYKNYNEQTKVEWINDVKGVAIDKYIKTFNNTEYFPVSSFIVHPDTEEKWTFFGGFLDKEQEKELGWENEAPNHKFGSFAFVPSQIINFKTFIKMMLEYHLRLYDYCWNCGEIIHSEEKIIKEKKQTRSGFDKYYYTCNTCGEFWVKTHCEKPEHHDLIKHLYNYHSLRKNSKYPWFVECPKCTISIDNDDELIASCQGFIPPDGDIHF